jgi:hypothetical protein
MCDCPSCNELRMNVAPPKTTMEKVVENISLKWLLRLNIMAYGFLGAVTIQLLLLVIGI